MKRKRTSEDPILPPWEERKVLLIQINDQPPQDLSILLNPHHHPSFRITWPCRVGSEIMWHNQLSDNKVTVGLVFSPPGTMDSGMLVVDVAREVVHRTHVRVEDGHIDWFFGKDHMGLRIAIWHNSPNLGLLDKLCVTGSQNKLLDGIPVDPILRTVEYRIGGFAGENHGHFLRFHLKQDLHYTLFRRNPSYSAEEYSVVENNASLEGFRILPRSLDFNLQREFLTEFTKKTRTNINVGPLAFLAGLHPRAGARGTLARVERRTTIFDKQVLRWIIALACGRVRQYK